MSPSIRLMRLSILAALGLSSTSVFAQEGPEKGTLPVCKDPDPILGELLGGSGYVRCADGRILRAQALWDLPGNPGEACEPSMFISEFSQCKSDADCTDRPFGSCNIDYRNFRGEGCSCQYRCMSDLDCRIGYVCMAKDAGGESQTMCVRATNCRTNDDCPSGQCELSYDSSNSFGGGYTLGCRSERDECHGPEDCPDTPCNACVLDPSQKRFVCPQDCFAVGRPFLVQGEALLADLKPGTAWIDEGERVAGALEQGLANRVAEHWLDCARMEHASVAAFARFALQLMHLGAPPELLQCTAQAMQDEIAHATACFAQAKRVSGKALSAGALEVSKALEQELAPVQIAVGVFLEGCIGESVAAIEAGEMSRLALDPQVRSLLEKIARDEHQHALLAWRFLGWMLKHLPESQSEEVRDALSQLVAQLHEELALPMPQITSALDPMEQHGVPTAQRKAALRRQALAQLVIPCASALFARQRPLACAPETRDVELSVS